MNSIATTQNAPEQLQLLAAQRAIYSRAKIILATQLVLALPAAISISFLALSYPTARPYAAFIGLVLAMLDAVILAKWQASLRKAGAEIQEAFDCTVLVIPWNQVKVKKPGPETIAYWSARYSKPNDSPSLKDWYRPELSQLPLAVARLHCQRSNVVWDSRQRKVYAAILPLLTIGVCITLVLVGLHWRLTIATILLAGAVPLAPLFSFSYRNYQDHTNTARRQEEIIQQLDDATEEDKSATIQFARAIQDEIYDYRVRSVLVFDWVFRLLHESSELRAKGGAQRIAAKVRHSEKKRDDK